jgi:5'-3' exoribonuclease 2
MQKGDVMRMRDDNPCDVVGIGSVQIKTDDGMTRTLKNIRYIPGMSRNLISLSTLDAEGYKYSGSDGILKVSKGCLVCLKGDLNSAKSYVLRGCTLHGSDSAAAAAVTNNEPSKTNLWHMRLRHMSHHSMTDLMKRNLLKDCTSSKINFCEHCIFGKHKRVQFNTFIHTSKGTLDYVHADLWGPSKKLSLGGARYMLIIIDDYSRRVLLYFLKQKDDTFAAFKNWKVMIERQTKRKVKLLCTDNGGEFCPYAFNDYYRQEGIVSITPYPILHNRMVWLNG